MYVYLVCVRVLLFFIVVAVVDVEEKPRSSFLGGSETKKTIR